MKFHSDEQRTEVLARLSQRSLLGIMAFNAAILMLAFFLSHRAIQNPQESYRLLSRIFFVVAIADLGVIYVVKRAQLAKWRQAVDYRESDYARLWNLTIIILALCGDISVLGLVGVILGNNLEYAVLMIAISLVAFQLFRLRPRDFEAD